MIFHMSIPCNETFSVGTIIFDRVTLTLEFDPFFENINPANNFWTSSARALIFHNNTPCYEIFLLVLNLLTLSSDQFKKKIGHNCLKIRYYSFHIAHSHFLWLDLSTGIKIFVLVILALVGNGHYRGHCVSQTSCLEAIEFFMRSDFVPSLDAVETIWVN